jgi:hypothetical protein
VLSINIKKRKIAIFGIITFVLISISGLYYSISFVQNSNKIDELNSIRSSRTETYSDILWVTNPSLTEPITKWYYTVEGDSSDAATSFSSNEAIIKVIGESYEKQVLLNNDTKSEWQAFNKSDLVVIPTHPLGGGSYTPTYGIDDEGCWCSHYWEEEETGGQPKNTPRMHWKTNVSLGLDMSDYIINEVSFEALINASVRWDIDTEGDVDARYATPNNVSINQHETYDYAQFYVEISTIDIGSVPLEESELNTYRIAFNQTIVLGNEDLSYYNIEGLIGEYGDQAIIDALNNVLAVDPGHDEFCVVLGIYMYCEDNNIGTDQDHWEDLRFKTLNMTFSYQKKIDQSTEISLNQDLSAINGTNVQILDSNLKFKFKIDRSWTSASNNSRIRIFINDRRYDAPVSLFLIDYTNSPNFQEASIDGFDITSKLLPYENFTLKLEVLLADTFGLDQNYTIAFTDIYLRISYSETFPDLIEEPFLYLGLFILALAAAILVSGYFLAYHFYLKYPVPVRKVRKYRKTLNQEKRPGVAIIPPGKSFGKVYYEEVDKSSKFLKGTPVNGKLLKKRIAEIDKTPDSSKKAK